MAIANYAKTCSANTPGNQLLAVTEIANIATVTVTAGEVSAITMEALLKFSQFDSDIDTLQLSMEGTGGSSYFQNNKIEMGFSKLSTGLITAKQSLVDAVVCGALGIVLDNNNQAWLVGYSAKHGTKRPLNKITANFASGAKPSDADTGRYTITLEGETSVDILPFDSATSALIAAGTATFITFN